MKSKLKMVDAIYLDKHTADWKYYRISSIGRDGDHIELCLLEFPEFNDLDEIVYEEGAVVVSPFDTGYASAYSNILAVLKNKWGIDHQDENLIGIRVRPL